MTSKKEHVICYFRADLMIFGFLVHDLIILMVIWVSCNGNEQCLNYFCFCLDSPSF